LDYFIKRVDVEKGSSNIVSLLISTRKRVKSLQRLFDSIEMTCKSAENLEVLLRIDEDDMETTKFVEDYKNKSKFPIIAIIGSRGNGYADLHKNTNELCQVANGKFFLFLPDDVQFMTKNWDEQMLATYNNVYSDNIFWINTSHHEEENPFATCLAITRDWYNVTGHFGTCYQQDSEFNYVAKYVGREVFLKDIVIIHHRVDPKPGIVDNETDQTYIEGRLAVDSGRLHGHSFFTYRVQTQIANDALKLLREIKKRTKKKDAETSAKIRLLYWENIRTRVFPTMLIIHIPFVNKLINRPLVKRAIKWVMRRK
jgi:hypothetical protein